MSRETKCYMLLRKSLTELQNICKENSNSEELLEERNFLNWYDKLMPYGLNDCVMNKICWYVEEAFKNYALKSKETSKFDYTIMKQEGSYSTAETKKLKDIYKRYSTEISQYCSTATKFKLDEDESIAQKIIITNKYKMECDYVCSTEAIQCNILLDLCYKSEKSKKFVWDMCGESIVKNLLINNNNMITYYVHDDNGEILYRGEHYTKKTKEVIM